MLAKEPYNLPEDELKLLKNKKEILKKFAELNGDSPSSDDESYIGLSQEELIAKLKTANQTIKEQDEVVQELKETVELKKDLKAPVTGEYDGSKYKFRFERFTVPNFAVGRGGREVTAEVASKDPKIMKHLVESKSEVIEKV